MKFKEYVETLAKFLADNPQTAEMKIFIGNGYCTSAEFVQVNRPPYVRPLLGKMGRLHPGDVVMLM